MIRAMVDYAIATGAQLCAEGVETAEERRVLSDAGVHLAQGHLFGGPRPAGTAKLSQTILETDAARTYRGS